METFKPSIQTSKEERELLEQFMGKADGFYSQFVNWHDLMQAFEKILGLGGGSSAVLDHPNYRGYNYSKWLVGLQVDSKLGSDGEAESLIEAVKIAVIGYIKNFNANSAATIEVKSPQRSEDL